MIISNIAHFRRFSVEFPEYFTEYIHFRVCPENILCEFPRRVSKVVILASAHRLILNLLLFTS